MLRCAQHDGSSQLIFADVTADQRDELAMNRGCRADDVAALEPAIAARKIADDSARFGDHQRSGGNVPRREMQLKKTVEDAGGGVGKIDRRRSGAAYAFRQ